MSALELVNESLELLVDESGEFNDELFKRFYELSPDAEGLMSHMDELMKGKMLEEVIRLLLVDDLDAESEYLDFEMKNHRTAYSVEHEMYRPFFETFHSTVKDFSPEGWRSEFDQAWQARIDEIVSTLDTHDTEAAS